MEASQISDRRQNKIYEFVSIKCKPNQVATPASLLTNDHADQYPYLSQEILHEQRAMRMLEFLNDQSFNKAGTIRRLRFLLLVWVIRNKIIENIKRAFDILVSSLTIVIAAPFMLLTAILIKLDSPGPVIFKQERVGKWGKHFQCYKFRSMCVDAEERKAELLDRNEADEIVFKMRRDPRVTRVGRVIRKLSIDEIPQLFNVLKGDMSLVGPRPPVPVEVVNYEYDQYKRLDAVPGITGLQQVSGRSDLEFKRWVELDLQYIQEQSLLKDIEILIKTIPTVIFGRGAY